MSVFRSGEEFREFFILQSSNASETPVNPSAGTAENPRLQFRDSPPQPNARFCNSHSTRWPTLTLAEMRPLSACAVMATDPLMPIAILNPSFVGNAGREMPRICKELNP